jgi:hypothetical protein
MGSGSVNAHQENTKKKKNKKKKDEIKATWRQGVI